MWSKNIGPCSLGSWGLTHGGVNLSAERGTVETKADATGDTARDIIITGTPVKITTAITEATLAQIASVFRATIQAGGTVDELVILADAGRSLLETATILIMKPIIGQVVSTAPEDWIYVPKAVIVPKVQVVAQLQDQKVWAFEATGLPVLAADTALVAEYGLDAVLRFGYAD